MMIDGAIDSRPLSENCMLSTSKIFLYILLNMVPHYHMTKSPRLFAIATRTLISITQSISQHW